MMRLNIGNLWWRSDWLEMTPEMRQGINEMRRLLIGLPSLPLPGGHEPLLEHSIEATHVETLVDLAKHGEEVTFKDLARTLGVPVEQLNDLWTGTVRRIHKGTP